MREIKKIAVLGASGNMGSLSGGIFAQANIRCYFLARTKEKAEQGVQNAINQARSSVLQEYISAHSYDELDNIIPECDWVFEGLAEDLELKKEFFTKIEKTRKSGTIVSTVSSGLSIEEMVKNQSEDFQQHFLGTHFYNPPGKLFANELIFHPKNNQELVNFISNFCKDTLHRKNIKTFNVPAFAGNRIGFQFLNYAAQEAENFGIEMIDYILGPHTGRAMSPLATIDLVGLDVHKAIVENVYNNLQDEVHHTYKMPSYMSTMISKNMLGLKSKQGFFKRNENKQKLVLNIKTLEYEPIQKIKLDFIEKAKSFIREGLYQSGIQMMFEDSSKYATLLRKFVLGYISYSFHRIGEVTPKEDFIHGIDDVMSFGFSWLPPSAWVDYLGGSQKVLAWMKQESIQAPISLEENKLPTICKIKEKSKFLIAR